MFEKLISRIDQETRTIMAGVFAIIGGVLIHLTYGSFYSTANLAPYVMSYFRMYVNKSLQTNLAVWLTSSWLACEGLAMPFGGIIAKKYGFRTVLCCSCFIQSCGIAFTYFAIQQSFAAVVFTYGMLNGLGVGLGYSVVIGVASTWFINNRALVVGLIVGGFGMSALIFAPIQTAFINSEDVKVDNQTRYFTDPDLLGRVPSAFLLLGGLHGTIQLIGLLLLHQNPENNQKRDVDGTKQVSLHPLHVLRCVDFHLLWLVFFFCIIPTSFVASEHKLFGQKYISDDIYLAAVVTISSIFNSVGRVLWGHVVDRISFKVPMILVLVLWIAVLFTFPHIGLVGNLVALKAMYAIWVCLIFTAVCGSFSIMPAAMASMFGVEYLAINFGMLFTAVSAGGIISGIAAQLMTSGDTFVYQFTGCGVCSVLGLLSVIWIDDRETPKRLDCFRWFTAQCGRARRPPAIAVHHEVQLSTVQVPLEKSREVEAEIGIAASIEHV